MRVDQLRFGVFLGALTLAALSLTACGSGALTTQPSGDLPRRAAAPAETPSEAFTSSTTKLRLIAQDTCQTGPAVQVYPNCDRFLAELRSAAGTVHNNAPGLPGGAAMAQTASAILTAAATFDKDGCGGSTDPSTDRVCVADLSRVRQGVSTLLDQTGGVPGTGG